MDSFQGLTTKSPSSLHRPLALSPNFDDHVNPITRRTINQSASGKFRDRNAEESCALLEDLALYDNEILIEYLVDISKRRAFWNLNEDILKIYYSDYQYAVSIKEDTVYLCLHSQKTIKERRSIRRIQKKSIRRIKDIDILIRASRLNKVMADKGKKSSMEIFAPNDKADYYSRITRIIVNGKNVYEQKGKFLDDMHNNAFSGTNGKDAVEHIEYYLKIIDPIKLPNVDHDKLRVVVFPISLAGGTRRWFDRTK
ncbi:hypothetical protein Tco_0532742 [Tanacetum coccineum]